MNLSIYHRSEKNSKFVARIRTESDSAVLKGLDDLKARLIDAEGKPPEWLDFDFWLLSVIDDHIRTGGSVERIFEALELKYRRTLYNAHSLTH